MQALCRFYVGKIMQESLCLSQFQAILCRHVGNFLYFLSATLHKIIQSDKMIYIPSLLVNLKEMKDGRKLEEEVMPSMTQCILLYNIQDKHIAVRGVLCELTSLGALKSFLEERALMILTSIRKTLLPAFQLGLNLIVSEISLGRRGKNVIPVIRYTSFMLLT